MPSASGLVGGWVTGTASAALLIPEAPAPPSTLTLSGCTMGQFPTGGATAPGSTPKSRTASGALDTAPPRAATGVAPAGRVPFSSCPTAPRVVGGVTNTPRLLTAGTMLDSASRSCITFSPCFTI